MFFNLQAEQARKGMTNAEVAEYLNLSRVTYEQKKRSGRFIVDECRLLCKLFSVEFTYLFETS